MSETKFTPGPWEVGDCDGATIWANAGTFAFAIGFATSDANVDRETAKANALLMAASPELYGSGRELDAAVGRLWAALQEFAPDHPDLDFAHGARVRFRAALAKARGQTE